MSKLSDIEKQQITQIVSEEVARCRITDIHTHLYPQEFGDLLLTGIDEMLVYHYLVAETMRWCPLPYDRFWSLPKRGQADIVWQTLFVDHVPFSEGCRGVLTTLEKLGVDTSSRNLDDYRAYFESKTAEEHVSQVLGLVNIDSVVMTNDPFDDLERPVWHEERKHDPRFHAALRIDTLLNNWHTTVPVLRDWGYDVEETVSGKTSAEVQRFLRSWIDRMNPLYMAASMPPDFAVPDNSPRGRLVEHAVLPVASDRGLPFAMMIGVKRQTNPLLKLAGDSAGKADVGTVEYLCANYPENKFMITMLARENQYELCVLTRKFRNLMLFGCWWFLNNPSLIEEITKMRFEMLGPSIIPQHSDARVLDQVIYKWDHAKKIIADVLAENIVRLSETGWRVTREELRRDVEGMFGGNFWSFLGR